MVRKTFLKNRCILMIIILGLFPPAYLNRFAVGDVAFSVIKAAGAIIIFLSYGANFLKHIKKPFNIMLVILAIELLFSTLISRDASIKAWAVQIGTLLIQCFFIEELIVNVPYKGVQCLYWFFSAMTIINTVTVFLFPNAMFPNNRGSMVCWFLGEDNGAYFYYVLASTFALLYCCCITRRVTALALLVWLSSFVFVFHNDIATGIVCQIIWLLLIIGYQFRLFRKLLKARYALYIMLAGFMLLVVLRKLALAPLVEALGRDITLSGRTIVWDKTIKLIANKPIFGYGICEGDVYAGMIKVKGILMAHDWLLNLGFAGGVVAMVIYVLQAISAVREGGAYQTSEYYRILVIGMIITFIRAVTEGSNWIGYFLYPSMICYSKEYFDSITSESITKKRRVRFKFNVSARRSRLT